MSKDRIKIKFGLGCMQLSSPQELEQATVNNIILSAAENNINFFDTAEFYGRWQADGPILHSNEQLVGEALANLPQMLRDNIMVGTKCGLDFRDGKFLFPVSEEQIRNSVSQSANALKTKKLQLLMIHRLAPNMTDADLQLLLNTLLKLISENKIEYVGFSEPTAKQIEDSYAVLGDKLIAVEIAYSVFIRRAEFNGVYAACKRLNIDIFAYSSFMRGFLAKEIEELSDEECQTLPTEELRKRLFTLLSMNDYRCTLEYFDNGHIRNNLLKLREFANIAKNNNLLPIQLSALWLADKGAIPIPGIRSVKQLIDYIEVQNIQLPESTFQSIDEQFPHGCFTGRINPPLFNEIENTELDEPIAARYYYKPKI